MHLSFDRGYLRLHGAPDKDDNDFARNLWAKVSSAARYHGGWRQWRFPATHQTLSDAVDALGVKAPEGVEDWLDYETAVTKARENANRLRELPPAKLRKMLEKAGVPIPDRLPFDHQVVGIAYILANPRAALFYDTGTGKTYTAAVAIHALSKLKGLKRCLIIAPKTIIETGWGEDIDAYTGLKWKNISQPDAPEPRLTCPKCNKAYKRLIPKKHILSCR